MTVIPLSFCSLFECRFFGSRRTGFQLLSIQALGGGWFVEEVSFRRPCPWTSPPRTSPPFIGWVDHFFFPGTRAPPEMFLSTVKLFR